MTILSDQSISRPANCSALFGALLQMITIIWLAPSSRSGSVLECAASPVEPLIVCVCVCLSVSADVESSWQFIRQVFTASVQAMRTKTGMLLFTSFLSQSNSIAGSFKRAFTLWHRFSDACLLKFVLDQYCTLVNKIMFANAADRIHLRREARYVFHRVSAVRWQRSHF